jgi:hypothetical protein
MKKSRFRRICTLHFMGWQISVEILGRLLGPVKGVSLENLDFFGPKWHSLRMLPFQGPKSLIFQGLPLPVTLVMDVSRIKIITFRAVRKYKDDLK